MKKLQLFVLILAVLFAFSSVACCAFTVYCFSQGLQSDGGDYGEGTGFYILLSVFSMLVGLLSSLLEIPCFLIGRRSESRRVRLAFGILLAAGLLPSVLSLILVFVM